MNGFYGLCGIVAVFTGFSSAFLGSEQTWIFLFAAVGFFALHEVARIWK